LPKGDATLVIRPSAARLTKAAAPDTLPAEIRKATYLGSHWDYTVATEVGELFIVQAHSVRFEPGAKVHLGVSEDQLALVSS
jgi:iron(III) transport system ATP-binding protein